MKYILCFTVFLGLAWCVMGVSLQCKGPSRISPGDTWCPSGDNCTTAGECSGSCTQIVSNSYWICDEGACVCTDIATASPPPSNGPTVVASYWIIVVTILASCAIKASKYRI